MNRPPITNQVFYVAHVKIIKSYWIGEFLCSLSVHLHLIRRCLSPVFDKFYDSQMLPPLKISKKGECVLMETEDQEFEFNIEHKTIDTV